MNQQEIVQSVKDKEAQIEVHRERVQELYSDINTRLQQSGGVRTSEVDENYKKIDREFGSKAKLEAEVRTMKKELLENILNG